jgi:DNA-binding transcriptional LysR family regulator
MQEINNKKIIMQCEGNDADTVALLEKYSIKIHYSYSVSEDSSMIALVECGFGISLMPELVLMGAKSDAVNILPIQPGVYRILGLATTEPQYRAPATQKFMDHVETFVAEKKRAQ